MSQLVTITDGTLTATIDSLGAQLMSLATPAGEYLWQGDPAHWSRRAPVLFPIVGVLRGDEAQSAQGTVSLKRHGLARLHDHQVVEKSNDSVTFELASSEATRADFPFDFRLNMTYTVSGGTLSQTFAVTNTGDVPLPFTLGGHPAFNVPAPGADDAFDEYQLAFPEAWTARVPMIDEAGMHDFSVMTTLFEGTDRLTLTHELIDRLLTLVFLEVPGRSVRLVGPAGHGVEVGFDGFDFLGVWSADRDAPFVAIEPWCGCATAYDESDVFEEKRGTITLEPAGTCLRTFTMRPF